MNIPKHGSRSDIQIQLSAKRNQELLFWFYPTIGAERILTHDEEERGADPSC